MTNEKMSLPEAPEWLKGIDKGFLADLPDRIAAHIVLDEFDFDAQLAAIHSLLRRQSGVDEEYAAEIKKLEESAKALSGIANDWAVDELVDRYHSSVYQDAAHSMAAVGMIAPFVESMFHQIFQGIRLHLSKGGSPPNEHGRWEQPAEDQWDCDYVWKGGRRSKHLADGILQLAEAVGLISYLPVSLEQTLPALFGYRNKMFHCGFEWPVVERERFRQHRIKEKWPVDWFSDAKRNSEPWICYMAQPFIDHCLDIIQKSIDGIGAFCKKEL
ncbi:MAG TPA: hypothetical protein VGM76_01085 [Lacipirellulaceae bacterium]|jgi:hypothetical protein